MIQKNSIIDVLQGPKYPSGMKLLSYRNQSIDCTANQLTGFYKMTALAFNELMKLKN